MSPEGWPGKGEPSQSRSHGKESPSPSRDSQPWPGSAWLETVARLGPAKNTPSLLCVLTASHLSKSESLSHLAYARFGVRAQLASSLEGRTKQRRWGGRGGGESTPCLPLTQSFRHHWASFGDTLLIPRNSRSHGGDEELLSAQIMQLRSVAPLSPDTLPHL